MTKFKNRSLVDEIIEILTNIFLLQVVKTQVLFLFLENMKLKKIKDTRRKYITKECICIFIQIISTWE